MANNIFKTNRGACIFFLLLFFIGAGSTRAASPSGGNITYTSLGNGKYLITARILRYCAGTPITTIEFGYYAGTDYDNSCTKDTLGGFSRVAINRITQVCKSETVPCVPANTTAAGQGFEEHVYQKTVDLKSSPFSTYYQTGSCGDISFYMRTCCRIGAIKTIQSSSSFTVTATIRTGNLSTCYNDLNSSGSWLNTFPSYTCCGSPVYFNPGYSDSSDNDSVSYALVEVLEDAPAKAVSYFSPFTYQYPLSPYCIPTSSISCSPNITTTPPRGLYLNNNTGDLIFTPVACGEVSVVAIEAIEWRKDKSGNWVEVSRSVNEMLCFTRDDCGYNNPPKISGISSSKGCAGEKICISVDATDDIFLPYQTDPDTLTLDWINPIKGATITIVSDSIPNKKRLQFCWQTTKNDGRDLPYQFEVIASDGSCPRPRFSSRAFTVLVQKKDSAWMEVGKPGACNTFSLQGKTLSDDPATFFFWTITDSSGAKVFFQGTKKTESVANLPPGTYKISLRNSSGKYCYDNIVKYITISTPLPKITLSGNKAVCIGSDAQVSASVQHATLPVTYQWQVNGISDSTSSSTLKIKTLLNEKLVFAVAKDSNGCIFSDSIRVKINALPEVKWTSSVLNSYCQNAGDQMMNPFVVAPVPSQRFANKFRITGSLTKFGPNGLIDSLGPNSHVLRISKIDNEKDLGGGKFVEEQLTMWFRDTNGCENKATTKVRINGYPVIVLQDRTFCQNELGEINTDSFVIRPKTKFGNYRIWTVVSHPKGTVKEDILVLRNDIDYYFQGGSKTLNQFVGDYELQLKVQDVITGCRDSKTMKVTLLPQPEMSLTTDPGRCVNEGFTDLTNLFLADSQKVKYFESNFQIYAFNGDTNRTIWKNVVLQNGYRFPASAGHGKWTILCSNKATGCFNSIMNDVRIDPMPLASFSTSPIDSAPINLPYFTVQNSSSVPGNEGITYHWYFRYPDLTDQSSAFAPVITYPMKDGFYTVRMVATTQSGCRDTFDRQLRVGAGTNAIFTTEKEPIFIDDQFRVSGVEFKEIELRVYDASGKLLRTITDNQGYSAPDGVYLYQLRIASVDNRILTHSGRMMVLETR